MSRVCPAGAPILTAGAMRAAEAATFAMGVAQTDLMEQAGLAVAWTARRFAAGAPVLVLAGPGNNGGDAYVAARHLSEWGHDVMVAVADLPRSSAALEMRARWTGPVVALADAQPRAMLIDGVFGTGMTRPLPPAIRDPLRKLVPAARFSLAIDLPSGLDADSGDDLGAARVSATLALGALKPAHLLSFGVAACGHVLRDGLGIAVDSDWHSIARPVIAPPRHDAHKYRRGLVGIVAGAMPGAAALAAGAAARGGAGYVVVAGGIARDAAVVGRAAVDRGALAAWLADDRLRVLLIGPGLGRGEAARALVETAIAGDRPLVLDGDALGLCSPDQLKRRVAPTILTPHGGEFAALFGAWRGSKIDATLAAARASGAVVVHKGPDTVIADPKGRVIVAAAATPWLATAGTGDVLAGLIASRLAVTPDRALEAAAAATWLHGHAARTADPAFAADDLIALIPGAIAECR
ncbi:NAD(P)H-hydrate dehydratase [Sphingomonas sp. SFZ2018-12]|uniref:NAD(P)H-hydrate dehydratase n=1 Tax=Sphingomonas sp. SFZ2018-12 TaxID=2683197 RepID=UPI001F0DBE97|nr:NAD(P)H-hydrate dehydratase [Sphingomonas sp. SFZ2018-12]MCH4892504.1 NAD(P)H-hydrate dehydratase [Sphingomonas sp. SFZ2018-12]